VALPGVDCRQRLERLIEGKHVHARGCAAGDTSSRVIILVPPPRLPASRRRA
jgi:hypothetical protein